MLACRCYDVESCADRGEGLIGSTSQLAERQPTFGYGGAGPLGRDPLRNPSWATWNHVMFWYCDGGSFTGDRTDPATTADGRKVWFRGRRNLDAMLGFLRDEHGNFDIIFDPFSAFSQPCAAPTRAV